MPGQKHTPTPERRIWVEEAVGHGMPRATIASILKCHVQTLERHYSRELAEGTDKANANVAKRLYMQAISDKDTMPNTVSRIFWMKSRARWRESQVIEHVGEDGAPLPHKPAVQIVLPHNFREGHAFLEKHGVVLAPWPLQLESEVSQ